MRFSSLSVLLCSAILVSSCAMYKDRNGNTHVEMLPPQPAVVYQAPPPPPPAVVYQAPPPAVVYEAQPPVVYQAPPMVYQAPPAAGVYIEGGGGGHDYGHDRAKRAQNNCNTVWTGCSNACNTIRDPAQRAVCVANCNNARNQCVRRNLGY